MRLATRNVNSIRVGAERVVDWLQRSEIDVVVRLTAGQPSWPEQAQTAPSQAG